MYYVEYATSLKPMNIVVFGGRSPIATAISQKLTASDSHVFHISRSENLLVGVGVDGLKISNVKMDLEDENESLRIWKDLVNKNQINSVVFAHRFRGDLDNFSEMYQCDVVTPFKLVQEWCKTEKSQEKRVLFFTSPASKQILRSQNFQYHATKSAISTMCKYFASGEIEGLISNAICPSSYVYKTRAADFYEKNISYFKKVSQTIPSGRYTQIEDIAITAEFLLIHAPSTINGLEITVDGGLSTLEQSNLIDRFNPLGEKP